MLMLTWEKLHNSSRRKDRAKTNSAKPDADIDAIRTEFERDYDRILFSTPVRRLGDKTQFFPLEPTDSTRTRLTHSHEVSNLARSIGVNIAFNSNFIPKSLAPTRNVPALLAAIGLAHDLGNSPFGHQGEESIKSWFETHQREVFPKKQRGLTKAMKNDFLHFDGNAQTFRLMSRLQILNDNFGLNLTYAALAALLKYTVPSDKIVKKSSNASAHKHGFFQSERAIVHEVWREKGLLEGRRQPFTIIFEGFGYYADSVLDNGGAVKKTLITLSSGVCRLQTTK